MKKGLSMKRGRKGDRGFSLLELVFALAILNIGFLFLSGLSISITKANKLSQNRTAALQLAQEKMEFLKTLSFSELRGDNESGLKVGNVKTVFQRETIVQKGEGPSLADVTVRVRWPGSSNPNQHHSTELFTRIAE
jgi:prepilin-type N-terminal cleavage/methylation domain-containing protein